MKTPVLLNRDERSHSETTRATQLARLREYLRRVVLPFSPHYRALFAQHGLTADSLRTWEDLRLLPFTSKADLLSTPGAPQKFRDFILTPDEHTLSRRPSTVMNALLHGREAVKRDFEREFRPTFMTSTTGRATESVAFLYTQHDLDNLAAAGRRVFEICGAKPDMRLVNMFPYAPHLAFWLTHYGATEFGVLMLSTGGGKVMGTDGNLRMIRKLRPEVLIGVPTFVYHVLHAAAEEGVYCENLRRLVLGGEKVPDGMRLKLRNLAAQLGAEKIDIVATYGFTEAKTAWPECPHDADESSGGYHLFPEQGIVEIVNPHTGEPVPDGEGGEIVFTPLDARGSVVLRYRTGDIIDGGLTWAPCPHCGRNMPRLVGQISRNSEVKELHLDKVKGTLVDMNELELVLDEMPNVGAWQLELRKRDDDPLEVDELVLHLNKSGDMEDTRLARIVSNRIASQAEIRPNRVVFHTPEEMRGLQGVGRELKEQKVVDHRPKAGAEPHPAREPAHHETEAHHE